MSGSRATSKLKQARSEQTRERIVDAGMRCFCERGYYRTSVRDIAAAAGVSVGSLYFHFHDKDEVFLEVMDIRQRRFADGIANLLADTDGYRSDRRAWCRGFVIGVLGIYGDARRLRADIRSLECEGGEIAARHDRLVDDLIDEATKPGRSLIIADLGMAHPRAAMRLVVDIVDATYDRTSLPGTSRRDKDDAVDECVTALCRYLFPVR